MKSLFYRINQNNSGGYFIDNDDVAENLIIEATSVEQAEEILDRIVEDYSDYCSCCGQRWYSCWDEGDGTEIPSIYGVPINEVKKSSYSNNCIVYYLDGRKEKIEFK